MKVKRYLRQTNKQTKMKYFSNKLGFIEYYFYLEGTWQKSLIQRKQKHFFFFFFKSLISRSLCYVTARIGFKLCWASRCPWDMSGNVIAQVWKYPAGHIMEEVIGWQINLLFLRVWEKRIAALTVLILVIRSLGTRGREAPHSCSRKWLLLWLPALFM